MHESLLVRVLHRLRNLTQERQALLDAKRRPILLNEVIQPYRVRIMLEDQGRAAVGIPPRMSTGTGTGGFQGSSEWNVPFDTTSSIIG